MVDLLPTVAGLLGIDPPEGVHLDGADLSPLLTGRRDAFTRSQPLFWYSPEGGAAVRDGQYSLVAYPDYEVSKDRDGMEVLLEQVRAVLEEANDPVLTHGDLRDLMPNPGVGFANKEAERLRIEYLGLNRFQERWIPTLKAGAFNRFELFDLEQDITQRTDISRERPEIHARLKKELLEIHASVMADGPDWSRGGKRFLERLTPSMARDLVAFRQCEHEQVAPEVGAELGCHAEVDLPQHIAGGVNSVR